mgnify:FL=1
MSWATCYSGSNNINFNFPPIMADGRNYASWQPSAIVNNKIQKAEGIHSNWTYRQFLQKNAIQIMNYNNKESCYYLGLDDHIVSDQTPSDNVPFKFQSVFDSRKPGFGYCNSDLKNPYLTREQLNARMISPSINYSPEQQMVSQNINKLDKNKIK